MNKTIGTIKVSIGKIIATIDSGIGDYYYSLIPLSFVARRPLYGNKITVVRSPPIETFDYEKGMEFDNKTVEIEYDGCLQYQQPYFYLDCWSKDIEEIRKSLGLTRFRNGFSSYHITIGNVKP